MRCIICHGTDAPLYDATSYFFGCRCRGNDFHHGCFVKYVSRQWFGTPDGALTCPLCRKPGVSLTHMLSWSYVMEDTLLYSSLVVGWLVFSLALVWPRPDVDPAALRTAVAMLCAVCGLQHFERRHPDHRSLLRCAIVVLVVFYGLGVYAAAWHASVGVYVRLFFPALLTKVDAPPLK